MVWLVESTARYKYVRKILFSIRYGFNEVVEHFFGNAFNIGKTIAQLLAIIYAAMKNARVSSNNSNWSIIMIADQAFKKEIKRKLFKIHLKLY